MTEYHNHREPGEGATVKAPPPSQHVTGIEEGIERAARYVEKQRDDYVQEFGMYDPSTGVTEFSTAGEEHLSTLEELIDGIRSLHETPTPPGNQIRTAECDGKDAVPVTGQLPVGTASTLPNVMGEPHPDDLAVDRFAAVMKAKLAQKRAEGRGGWDNPDECSIEWLSELLRSHVEKADPVDVGNFAMMIHQRGGRICK